MRVAFVVQRYGTHVIGGAEVLCRQLAARLSRTLDIHVLTTCALGYDRWANHYPAGVTEQGGITLHRFPVSRVRNVRRFRKLNTRVLLDRHAYPGDEVAWTLSQGPDSCALLDHIRSSQDEYDAFVFFTYLYYPTIWGLPLVAEKSLLVPTAHDEAPIYLDIFRSVFHLPRHIIFLTEEERSFVHAHFHNQHIPWSVIGTGIDLPVSPDGAGFRVKFGLDAPFILYVGRITESKNCDELFSLFQRYKSETPGDLKLVLLGQSELPIPTHADIVYLGYVSEEDKLNAYRAAEVVVMPSHYESLSIVTLEAMSVGSPLLVSGRSEVLRGHCRKSNAGLYYTSYEEFALALSILMRDKELRAALGERGVAYVERHYPWSEIEKRYLEAIANVATQPHASHSYP